MFVEIKKTKFIAIHNGWYLLVYIRIASILGKFTCGAAA
jgi:hypothetical protein